MDTHQQKEIFRAMELPDFYPHPVTAIRQMETHISKVYLTGKYVYKIKKPLDLGFLDFSTLEKRQYYCKREIKLNRRLSKNIYLDVIPITCQNGRYELAGSGQPVEYAVKMRQLPDERALVNLLVHNLIEKEIVEKLGKMLADFYLQNSSGDKIDATDVWKNISNACEENFIRTKNCVGKLLEKEKWEKVRSATLSFLQNKKNWFNHRIEDGKIQDCHGDLRTEHIYVMDDGTIQVIDCIEFNDRLRRIDVASDLAFLLMDFDYRGKPELSALLLDFYMRYTGDMKAFSLLSFYKCYRAFVRCKVNCILMASNEFDHRKKRIIYRSTPKYQELAYQYALDFSCPTLWVVCGMPAAGKSTIAMALSKLLDIRTYSSDVVRKELFDMQPKDHSEETFEAGIYAPRVTDQTYNKLKLLAQKDLVRGHSAILDATYSRAKYRQELMELSKNEQVKLFFVECVASIETHKERLLKRQTFPSVSDARCRHFKDFQKRFEPLTEVEKNYIRVDTGTNLENSLRQILLSAYTANLAAC